MHGRRRAPGSALAATLAALAAAWLAAPALGAEERPTWDALKRRVEELYKQQRYAEAAAAAELALEAAEATFDPNDSHLGAALNDLATMYRVAAEEAKMRYEQKGLALYQRALSITERSLGLEHASVATISHNLARLHQSAGRHDESERLFRRALRIREAGHGGRDPRVAETLTSLADLLFSQGRVREARPLYVRAAEIYQAGYGADHPMVVMAQQQLAALMRTEPGATTGPSAEQDGRAAEPSAAGSPGAPESRARTQAVEAEQRDAEAESQYRWKLNAMQEALGPDHHSLAPALTALAKLYRGQNRLDEAETLLERALAITEKHAGAESEETAAALLNLAELYHAQQRYVDAEPLYDRYLTYAEKSGGSANHPDFPKALELHLNCVTAMGNKQKIRAAKARAKRAAAQ